MPLSPGSSEAVKSSNIREMIANGHPKDQAVAAALDMARRTKRISGGAVLKPAVFDRQEPAADPAYVYHATNHERLQDIADSGKLKTHKPHEYTDQSTWPDGRTEKRAYFSHDPKISRNFAPEEGRAALLRTKRTPVIRKESGTSDFYSREPIHAKDIDYLHESGDWHPLRPAKADGGSAGIPKLDLKVPLSRPHLHTGPIHSGVAGRTDHLPIHVPNKAYVLPADIVSGMGEGNTMAGFKIAKRLPRLFSTQFYGTGKAGAGTPYGGSFYGKGKAGEGAPYGGSGLPYGGVSPPHAKGGGVRADDDEGVPIVAAGGEHVYAPHEVEMIGGGDIDHGHDILDAFVKQYRAEHIKTLKALPGPRRD